MKEFRDQDPIVPSAVAPLPDGSFAVVDPERRRVVEVSVDGKVGRPIVDIPQVASDAAWDAAHNRLLVLSNESEGEILEVPAGGSASRVLLDRPVSRLVPTDHGVFGLGARSYEEPYGLTEIPAPLVTHPAVREGGLVLADDSVVSFSSNRSGSRWVIKRGDSWELDLTFTGVNGPARPSLSLTSDMLVAGDTLVTAPLVGTLARSDVTRQLLLIRVDLKTGQLLGTSHIRQCGLVREENVVSRISAGPDGTLHQLCVGQRSVQLRRNASTQ